MASLLLHFACLIVSISGARAQQTLFLTDFAKSASLVSCASEGFFWAVGSLTDDCNFSQGPVTYASCACLKDQNSIAVSTEIEFEVNLQCDSTATDDVSSALAVFSSYCAPVKALATTTTTQALPSSSLGYLTNIAAAATGLAPCAVTGLSEAVQYVTSDCPVNAGPTMQASCACLKDQNSIALSQEILRTVGLECSSTATDDINSALAVFSDYCSLGGSAASAAATPFQPSIKSLGPMSDISDLTSLAPCASAAFTQAVADLDENDDCNGAADPSAFASCACANATNSAFLSVNLVQNVEQNCESTATNDITSALAVFSSYCVLAGGATGPATAAVTGQGAVTCMFSSR